MIKLPAKTRWIIVFFALFMMISSVSTSTYLVRKNDITITKLRSDVGRHNELIRSLWQNTVLEENRLNMLALYTVLSHNNYDESALQNFTQAYAQHLQPQTSAPIDIETLPVLLTKLKDSQQKAIDRIDHVFIEKQEWEVEISRLSQKNLLYMSIALFAQLLSVASITIARDLK